MVFCEAIQVKNDSLCGAYAKYNKSDYYPTCESKNCPMLHPELINIETLKVK